MASGDQHEEHYEELRRRVLDLHRAAVRLDGQPSGGARSARPEAADSDVEDDGAVQDDTETAGDDAGSIGRADAADDAAGRALELAVGELTEATDAMLAYGDRLPVLKDLPARALSVQVVRAAALAVLLGGVLVGLGIWRQILSAWWLPVGVVMVPVAVRTATLPVAPAAGRHLRQRWAAGVGGAAGLLFAPVEGVFGPLPGLVCVLAFVVAVTVLLELRWVRS